MLAKDIKKANTRCVVLACEQMNIPYKIIDTVGNVIEVTLGNKEYYFVYSRNPMTTITEGLICRNKGFTDSLFKEELKLPYTRTFFDPKHENYVLEDGIKNYDDILKAILNEFDELPIIVKMSTGSQGRNVFKCNNKREIKRAIRIIFDQKQRHYSSTLLVQKYVDIEREFRVLVMNGEVKLVYEKASDNKDNNLSPLHNDGAKAVIIDDQEFLNKMQAIVDSSPKFKKNFTWNGLDIAQQPDGSYVILELNAHPLFEVLTRDNGDQIIIDLYKEVFEFLRTNTSFANNYFHAGAHAHNHMFYS
jgi:glutathione synthase/RimK-type ligase-like ATP-grasp enzyme